MGFLDSLKKLFGGGKTEEQPMEQPQADQGGGGSSMGATQGDTSTPQGGQEEKPEGGMQ